MYCVYSQHESVKLKRWDNKQKFFWGGDRNQSGSVWFTQFNLKRSSKYFFSGRLTPIWENIVTFLFAARDVNIGEADTGQALTWCQQILSDFYTSYCFYIYFLSSNLQELKKKKKTSNPRWVKRNTSENRSLVYYGRKYFISKYKTWILSWFPSAESILKFLSFKCVECGSDWQGIGEQRTMLFL